MGLIVFWFKVKPCHEFKDKFAVFLCRKAPLEKTPERTHTDYLMTVTDQMKAKHLVSVLKDPIQTLAEDLVME